MLVNGVGDIVGLIFFYFFRKVWRRWVSRLGRRLRIGLLRRFWAYSGKSIFGVFFIFGRFFRCVGFGVIVLKDLFF